MSADPSPSFAVSVVVPCRNAGRWIGRSLASAAGQTHPPLEIIVVDDGSTDDSAAEVSRTGLASVLLRGAWGNAAAARNAAIRKARGDWIAFLDADDVWYPEHLARARDLLSGTGDVALMANHDWVGEDDAVIAMPESVSHRDLVTAARIPARRFAEVLARGFHFGHSTVLVRRERTLEVGLFDEDLVRRHDVDHWLRVIAGRTWAYDTARHAGYRVSSPGSLSKDVVRCEVFYLRALLKNFAADGDSTAMQSLVRTSARRAMSLSFVDGTAEDYGQARHMAWPHLSQGFRVAYRMAEVLPSAARSAIRLKRALRSRLITAR